MEKRKKSKTHNKKREVRYMREKMERVFFFFFFKKHKRVRVSRDEREIILKNLVYSYRALLLLACSKNNLAFKTSNGTFLVC